MMIQHNLAAMNANRMYNNTVDKKKKSAEKLSSGYKINRAADNAAGLSISEKMRRQIRGLDRGSTNSDDGISMVQTAEGALNEVHDMLHRMNELAVQAANGTNSESDRQAIQDEISQIESEIDRVSESTKFNEEYLLKGGHTETTKRVWAHDAGLKGKLSQGEIISSFEMKRLLSGDQIQVGPVKYTVGTGKGDVQKLIAEEARGGDTVKVRTLDGEYDIDTYHIIELEEENEAEAQQVSYIQSTMGYNKTEQVDIGKTDGVEKYELIDVDHNNAHAETNENVKNAYTSHGIANTGFITITDPNAASGSSKNRTYQLLFKEGSDYYRAETNGKIRDAFNSSYNRNNVATDVKIGATEYHALKYRPMLDAAGSGSATITVNSGANTTVYGFGSDGLMNSKKAGSNAAQTVYSVSKAKSDINNAITKTRQDIDDEFRTKMNALNAALPSSVAGFSFSFGSGTTTTGTDSPNGVTGQTYGDSEHPDRLTSETRLFTRTDTNVSDDTITLKGEYKATIDGVERTYTYEKQVKVKKTVTSVYDGTQSANYTYDAEGNLAGTDLGTINYNVSPSSQTVTYTIMIPPTSDIADNGGSSSGNNMSSFVGNNSTVTYKDNSGNTHNNILTLSDRSKGTVLGNSTGADTIDITNGGTTTFTNASIIRSSINSASTDTKISITNTSGYYDKFSVQSYDFSSVGNLITQTTVGAYSDDSTLVSYTDKDGNNDVYWKLRDYNYSSVYNMLSDGAFENSRYEDGDVYGIRVAVTNSGDTKEYTAETTHYRQKECVAYGEDEEGQIDTPGAERDDLFFGAQRVDFHGKSYVLMVDQDHNGYDDEDYHIVDEGRAYKIIANELTVASSIGCDVDKPVVRDKNNNDIVDNVTMAADFLLLPDEENSTVLFNIERGTTRVKKDKNIEIHAGTDADMNNKISVDLSAMSAAGLGIKGINVKDSTGYQATYAIDAIETAIMEVSRQRSLLGAAQNRMEHTIKNLDNVVENTTASESRIRDTDIADEMVKNSTADILAQAGQAMLSQANQTPQGVLNLLG